MSAQVFTISVCSGHQHKVMEARAPRVKGPSTGGGLLPAKIAATRGRIRDPSIVLLVEDRDPSLERIAQRSTNCSLAPEIVVRPVAHACVGGKLLRGH